MRDSNEHDSEASRAAKREALGVLFLLCPRGDDGASLTEIYLRAARKIPAPIYVEACSRMMEKWEDTYTFPLPAHIRTAAKGVYREIQEQRFLRETKQREQDAMTPGQALELLDALASEPEPDPSDDTGKTLRRLRKNMLQRAAARGLEKPQLAAGE